MSRSLKARASILILAGAFTVVALFVVLHGARYTPAASQELLGTEVGVAANEPSGAMPRAADYVPTEGTWATSENVDHVGFIPFEEDSGRPVGELIPNAPQEILSATGANIRSDYMYLTSWKNISVYGISDPQSPVLTDIEPVGFQFENENVATNGEILLFSEQLPGDKLHIWDVSNKQNIREIATLKGAGNHTRPASWGAGGRTARTAASWT